MRFLIYLFLVLVGAVLLGGLIGFYNILQTHYGSDFANDWIFIFVFLNTWGFLRACSLGFQKIRGE